MSGLFGAAEEAPKEETPPEPDPAPDDTPDPGPSDPFALLSLYAPGPGEWSLVPGTAFENIRLSDSTATSLGIFGADGSRAVLNNQNGAAYDPDGHKWYFWGGGATAYGGNEVYELNLATLELRVITTPSALDGAVAGSGGGTCAVPTDGPAAGSTYDGLVWSPVTQSLFVFPTGNFCTGDTAPDSSVWEFDPATGSWTRITNPGDIGGQVMAEYDPLTQQIVVIQGNNVNTLMELDPATGTRSDAVTLSGQSIVKGSAVLRPLAGDLLLLTQAGVVSVPLDAPGSATLLGALDTGVGPQFGAAFDTSSGLLTLWDGGTEVRTFDPATGTWDTHVASSGPSQQGSGVYSKWIYLPDLDLFAGYNNVDEGLWLYRMPAPSGGDSGGGGSPSPSFAVSALTLINTDTQQPVGAITNGQTIDLAVVGRNLNVRGDVSGTVESIAFDLSGSARVVESNPPYALFGDVGGNFNAWTPSLTTYQLTATPYSQNSAGGTAGQALTVSFTVIDSGSGGSGGGSGSTNQAPTANAGTNQTVSVGQNVTLDGTGSSDPDGDSLIYSWSLIQRPAGSTATLSNATTANPMFVADIAGTFIAQLIVGDSLTQSVADQVVVTALAGSGGGGGGGSVWNVSNDSQLQAALSGAAGGDEIVLASGNYGVYDITRNFMATVTVRSAVPLGATFADINIRGGGYIHFDGVRVNDHVMTDGGAHHFGFSNSDFRGMFLKGVNNVVLENNVIHDGNTSVVTLLNSSYITISENTIRDSAGDLLQVLGDSHHVSIVNNQLLDVQAGTGAHPDLIQMFKDFSTNKTPHDITIRGNLLYDDPTTGTVGAQGIFMSDPGPTGYRNMLIEQNLLAPVLTNALTIHGAPENVVIRNNTVTRGRIWVPERNNISNAGVTVEWNVAPVLNDDSSIGGGATVQNNFIYGGSHTTSQLFQSYFNGSTYGQYVPRDGGPIAYGTGYGAQSRLLEVAP